MGGWGVMTWQAAWMPRGALDSHTVAPALGPAAAWLDGTTGALRKPTHVYTGFRPGLSNCTIFIQRNMTVTRPLRDRYTSTLCPCRPSAQAKLADLRPQAEGTLCPKLGRAAARAEGLRPRLAPLARAEGRGCTLSPSALPSCEKVSS